MLPPLVVQASPIRRPRVNGRSGACCGAIPGSSNGGHGSSPASDPWLFWDLDFGGGIPNSFVSRQRAIHLNQLFGGGLSAFIGAGQPWVGLPMMPSPQGNLALTQTLIASSPISGLGAGAMSPAQDYEPVLHATPAGAGYAVSSSAYQYAQGVAAVGAVLAVGMVPGPGEIMDLAVILDREAATWERGLAAVSLAASILTGGVAPNFGAVPRAAKGMDFYRGAKPGTPPSFVPRSNDFKIDTKTGFVKETHGVSVFDNAASVSSKGFIPHRVDQSSVPNSLRIIQRGRDPHHFEIVPKPGTNLSPQQFIDACGAIRCAR